MRHSLQLMTNHHIKCSQNDLKDHTYDIVDKIPIRNPCHNIALHVEHTSTTSGFEVGANRRDYYDTSPD